MPTTDTLKETIEYFIGICYPKAGQNRNIHSEDIRLLAPFLQDKLPAVIVELGAGYGTSSKLFAGFAKIRPGGRVYSIEPYPVPEWLENIAEFDLQDYIVLIPKASPWVNWDENIKIDFLFIDGMHNFRNVMMDYFYWEKFVPDDGFIAFHDSNWPAVRRAIDEIRKTEYLEPVSQSTSRVGLEIYRKVKDKRGRVAFFGPWVGEFGFEVGWWQGFCRKQARNYDHSIISTKPGNEGLYKDFADEIIPHNLTGEPICGYARALKGDFDYPKVEKVFAPQDKKFIPAHEQEYIVFGEKNSNPEYDILLHCNEHRKKQYPEWPAILEALKGRKIACFGKKTGGYPDLLLDGCADLRDIPLDELAGFLHGAKVVIGPSSGVMHYASFCNAKIVAWADRGGYTFNQTVRDRFERVLNPHHSPVIVLDDWGWLPPAKEVIDAALRFL